MRILVISKYAWVKDRLSELKPILERSRRTVEIDYYKYDAGRPEVVWDKDHNRISRTWYQQKLSPLAEGYDAIVFHFSDADGIEWGVDSGLRGNSMWGYNVAQLWIKCDEKDTRTYKNGVKIAEFKRLFLHECSHWFAGWLGVKDETHVYDRDKYDIASIFPTYDFTRYSLLRTLKAKLAGLLGQLRKDGVQIPLPYENWQMVTQHFGVPNDSYPSTKTHIGTDFRCPVGTDVYAPADGEIVSTTAGHPVLGHSGCFEFTYNGKLYTMRVLHLFRPPKLGVYKKGAHIADTGMSGQSTGPHAHIEIWVGKADTSKLKSRADVMKYLDDPVKFFG